MVFQADPEFSREDWGCEKTSQTSAAVPFWRSPLWCFVWVLGLCVASGWRSDLRDMFELLGCGVLALVSHLVLFARFSPQLAVRCCLGTVVLAFVWVSGVASVQDSRLGGLGPVFFHATILIFCGGTMLRVLWRAARQETLDADFMQLDLWLYNAALVCFAGVFCLEMMRAGIVEQVLKGRNLAGVGPILAQAVVQSLVPFSYILLFSLVLKNTKSMRRQRTLSFGTVCSVALAIVLSGVSGSRYGFDTDGEPERRSVAKSAEATTHLKYGEAVEAIRRKVEPLMSARQFPEALNEMQGLEAIFSQEVGREGDTALWRAYLRARKGTDFGAVLTRPLKSEHAFLLQMPEEEELLLSLFLWNGLMEPLSERYAWMGFPQLSDAESFAAALEALRVRQIPSQRVEVEYFSGILKWKERRFLAARRHFERVLELFPGHANATVFLERIARETNRDVLLRQMQSSRRRLGGTHEVGSGLWGTVTRDALWLPLEMNPGFYEVALDVQLPGSGMREVRVFRSDRKKPLFRESVACGERQRISFYCEAKEADWYGLRIEGEEELNLLGGTVRFQERAKP